MWLLVALRIAAVAALIPALNQGEYDDWTGKFRSSPASTSLCAADALQPRFFVAPVYSREAYLVDLPTTGEYSVPSTLKVKELIARASDLGLSFFTPTTQPSVSFFSGMVRC